MDETPNQQIPPSEQDPSAKPSPLREAINSWYRAIPPKLKMAVLAVLAVVGIISLILTFIDFQTTNQANQQETKITPSPIATTWETYKSKSFPFEFSYPTKLELVIDNYNGQESITLSERLNNNTASSNKYPTYIHIKLYGKGFVTFTEDKSLTTSYQAMYQKGFTESMSINNGIKTRTFSGYIDGDNDGKLNVHETTAYIWNEKGEVLVRADTGEHDAAAKEEIQKIISSVKITNIFPPVNPMYLEPTIDPNAEDIIEEEEDLQTDTLITPTEVVEN